MRRSLSHIQVSSGGGGGGGARDGPGGGCTCCTLGSVLRRRTFPRFLSMVACGTRSAGREARDSGVGRARGAALRLLQHRRLRKHTLSPWPSAPRPALPPAPIGNPHDHVAGEGGGGIASGGDGTDYDRGARFRFARGKGGPRRILTGLRLETATDLASFTDCI